MPSLSNDGTGLFDPVSAQNEVSGSVSKSRIDATLKRWHRAILAWLGPGDGITPAKMVALFFILLLVLFTRRPGDLLHPCFYAEDGVLWYADAYNLHWARALLIPNASYLQVLPRLIAGIALWPHLRWAPLILNLAGASIQVAPVLVLLSSRASTWGSLPIRALMAAVYLACPNVGELHVNITNAQWHLALLQVLLALSHPPRHWFGKFCDVVLFALGALSGPFGLVLLPVLAYSWFRRRERWLLLLMGCLVPGLMLQVHTLVYGYALGSLQQYSPPPSQARVDEVLGASPGLFIRIVGGCVFLDSLIGHSPFDKGPFIVPVVFFCIGSIVVTCGMLYGAKPLRPFAMYTAVLFAAALTSPMAADPVSRWHQLSLDGGVRYYFFPMLVYLWSAIYTVCNKPPELTRRLCVFVLCVLVLGLARWVYKPFPDRHFMESARQFESSPAGVTVHIPINPVPWVMTLTKH